MIKFLIGVFVFLFVIPFMIFSLWAYFDDKKNAKNQAKNTLQSLPNASARAQIPWIERFWPALRRLIVATERLAR